MEDAEKQYIASIMPTEISDALFDDVQDGKINNLSFLLHLSENKSILLLKEVSDVLMGITNYDQLKLNLKHTFNLPDNLVEFAFNKLKEIVFDRFSEQISFMQSSLKKWKEGAVNQSVPILQNTEKNSPVVPPALNEKNTLQILDVIKNLSQKKIQNTAAVISNPVIIKEANPNLKPTSIVDEKPKIEKKIIDEKPNKLLQAMQTLQQPRSKIDTLLETYNKKTANMPSEIKEVKNQENEFGTPFSIKKSPSFIQKNTDEGFNANIPKNIVSENIPDILKMKEVREASHQNPQNIRLDDAKTYGEDLKKPIKYNVVETDEFKPYQYEKGKNPINSDGPFVDLSEL